VNDTDFGVHRRIGADPEQSSPAHVSGRIRPYVVITRAGTRLVFAADFCHRPSVRRMTIRRCGLAALQFADGVRVMSA
jgi:hypothetical protein